MACEQNKAYANKNLARPGAGRHVPDAELRRAFDLSLPGVYKRLELEEAEYRYQEARKAREKQQVHETH
jgi:hypothetical protein